MLFVILNTNDIGRLIIIYVIQLFLSGIFLFLAYKILRRNRNRLTTILSSFYAVEAIAFIFNAIYPSIGFNPGTFIIYFIAAYLISFGPIFLILFNINLIRIDSEFTIKKQTIIILIYGLSIFLLLNIPGGITINEETNWSPLYSWYFLIILYIFFSVVIIVPFIFQIIKLYRTFEDKNLKKKLRYFIVGFSGYIFSFYGVILYNTWNEPTFRLIWNVLILVILIPSASLIYYAWIHRL